MPEHYKLDIRFEDEDVVVLVETKVRFKKADEKQLQDYLDEEIAVNHSKKIIAILANTGDDKIKVCSKLQLIQLLILNQCGHVGAHAQPDAAVPQHRQTFPDARLADGGVHQRFPVEIAHGQRMGKHRKVPLLQESLEPDDPVVTRRDGAHFVKLLLHNIVNAVRCLLCCQSEFPLTVGTDRIHGDAVAVFVIVEGIVQVENYGLNHIQSRFLIVLTL